MRRFYVLLATVFTTLIIFSGPASSQTRYRTPIEIPDIPGYKTLKTDLHIHTVFSDGSVWPDIRSEEAWREGFDAIAITDHIEYQPHKDDLPTNHNRSFEIAKPHGDRLALHVIRGSEVTRKMPPGHINAVFIEDAAALDTKNWRDAIQIASDQGAFIFWNHPGWAGQQPDGIAKWYPEHTELVDKGMLHGIEVVNTREYYPEAHRWCIERNLTMIATSDIHYPLNLDYHVHQGDHRPMTLVFATQNSPEAIKEALFARRTAVYSGDKLIGDEQYLRPIFDASVDLINPSLTIEGKGGVFLRIRNNSEIDYQLTGSNSFGEINIPEELILKGGATVLLGIGGTTKDRSGSQTFRLNYQVGNLLIGPDTGMDIHFDIEVTFVPVAEQTD